MKCMDALDALLSADMESMHVGGELADHLLTCSRCQTIAAQLRCETAALAGVVSAVPVQVRPDVGRTPARTLRRAALALAALVLVVFAPSWLTHQFEEAPLGARAGDPRRTAEGTAPRALADGARPQAERVGTEPHGPSRREPIGISAPSVDRQVGADGSPRSGAIETSRDPDLGVSIPAPMPVEAVAILPVAVVLEELRDALEPIGADSLQRTLVLLPQSNRHITVFWVY